MARLDPTRRIAGSTKIQMKTNLLIALVLTLRLLAADKKIDLSKEKAGKPPATFEPMVGTWVVAEDGPDKVIMVDGRPWVASKRLSNNCSYALAFPPGEGPNRGKPPSLQSIQTFLPRAQSLGQQVCKSDSTRVYLSNFTHLDLRGGWEDRVQVFVLCLGNLPLCKTPRHPQEA